MAAVQQRTVLLGPARRYWCQMSVQTGREGEREGERERERERESERGRERGREKGRRGKTDLAT